MRTLALGLIAALGGACGGGKSDTPIDAPRLPACETPITGSTISIREVGQVEDAAMIVVSPPLDLRRFVVERVGTIRIYENDQLLPEPFIDLSESIRSGGEQGLLGLAFHPQYQTNGQFFVYYTTSTANVVARCTVSSDNPNRANPTCTTVLSIPDFAGNHNGGMMEFGRDGYLYIGTGDGGGGGDPNQNGQSLVDGDKTPDSVALLGKMLRIDVDNKAPGKEYGIPADNPFAQGGGAPEIFLIGLRNPWRWSFDKETGDLWIGDVGQGEIEELTVLRAGDQAGKNLGWNMYEGSKCFASPCDPTNMTMPQDERSHGDGWISIIAGEVYRGTCYPDLVGWHFYTDHASNVVGLWKARLQSDGSLEIVDTGVDLPGGVASIHADARGELFITTIGGSIHHIEAGP